MGKAEIAHGRVDVLGERAVLEHVVGLPPVAGHDAVADEPVADAGGDGDFLQALAEREASGQHVRGGVAGDDQLEQFHHMGGGEEVQADDARGVLRVDGDLVDVEVGGVGGEDGIGPGDGVKFGEDGLLDVHVLEHRLDDEVAMGQRAEIGGDGQRGLRVGAGLGAQKPAFGAVVEDGEDAGAGKTRALVVAFDHGHEEVRQQTGGGDARTHGAATEDADLREGAGGDALCLGQAGDGALGKEDVAEGCGLVAVAKLDEGLAFGVESRVGGERQAPLHRAYGGDGGQLGAGLCSDRGFLRVERVGIGWGTGGTFCQGYRYTGSGSVEGQGFRGGVDVVRDLVDQADLKGLAGRHRLAARDHVEREVGRDQPGQQDRAARAGDDAEIDLRQAEPRAGGRDPVGTAKCHLQPAAKCDALDGRNPWFARAVELADDVRQRRVLRGQAEFADVGTRNEAVARAAQDGGLDVGGRPRSG
jgi:hypothetical protein